MKIKTSVSIDEDVLSVVKNIARRDDRSVSYVLEKFIEDRARELPEPPTEQGDEAEPEKVNYRTRKKRGSK